jgi:hypothetical protein
MLPTISSRPFDANETHRRVVRGSINVEILDKDIFRFDNDTSPELRLNDGKVLDDYILGIRDGKRHWSIISLASDIAQWRGERRTAQIHSQHLQHSHTMLDHFHQYHPCRFRQERNCFP